MQEEELSNASDADDVEDASDEEESSSVGSAHRAALDHVFDHHVEQFFAWNIKRRPREESEEELYGLHAFDRRFTAVGEEFSELQLQSQEDEEEEEEVLPVLTEEVANGTNPELTPYDQAESSTFY